jgi:hypothetical protein
MLKTKIAKLPFGWFPVDSVTQNNKQLLVSINASNVLPPTPDDIKILDRALELLSSTSYLE